MKERSVKGKIPDINSIIDEIMNHYERDKIGMIASHIGVVRGYSTDGRKVKALEISFDREKLNEIVKDIKSRQGITEVKIKLNEGTLMVGDWIMIVMVAGEMRDKVFPSLIDTVNRIKKEASIKKEIF